MRQFLLTIGILCLLTVFTTPALAGEQDCADVCAEYIRHGLSPDVINAYQMPDFDQLHVDNDMLNDRRYMRVNGEMVVYDAPNGNVTRTLDEGFNFVTAIGQQGDWIQINGGEWVRAEQLTDANGGLSQFTGIMLDGDYPQYRVAWVLVNTYPSKEPGGDPVESNGLTYRYTLVNIFDTVEIDDWEWYQIGVDRWIIQTSVAKVLPVERPESVTTDLWVSIDLYEQVLTVFEDDKPVFATLIATGLPRWPTYEGTFNIYFRQLRRDMSWGVPGDDFYAIEEVPWTMFFDEGRALHGAYWHDGLGYRRSHGCVNLSITDAHWLYQYVADEMGSHASADVEPEGPNVYVYSSGTYR
jgi:hypothetical protein